MACIGKVYADTNITEIKKIDDKVIFEVANVGVEQKPKESIQSSRSSIKQD